jgi:hypothetical protein
VSSCCKAAGRPAGPAAACILAAATRARYLVTRDKDLLDLMGDDAFRQQFPGLAVIDPVTLRRELAMDVPKTELDRGSAEDEAQEGTESE